MKQQLVHVNVEQHDDGQIAMVTLNRVAKRNALDTSLLQALSDTIDSTSAVDALRLVVVRSACDGVFSAGADVQEMAALDGSNAALFIRRIHKVCQSIVDCPVPVLAVIDGVCVGAAVEIVASCDLRLATSQSRFSMPEVLVGLPSVVEAARLPQLIGFGRTRRLLYTGETIDAQLAEQWGLVEFVCDTDQLQVALGQLTQQLLATAPVAMRIQKKLIRRWEMVDLDAGINAGIDAFEHAYQGDEPRQWLGRQAASLGKKHR